MLAACCIAVTACTDGSVDDPGSGGESEPSITVNAPSDRELEARLRGIYAELPGTQDLEVRVRQGVVHLGGAADTIGAVRSARGIAHRLEGVVEVRSEIESRPSNRLLVSTWHTLRGVGRDALRTLPRLVSAVVVFAPFVTLAWVLRRWRRPLHRFGVRTLTGSVVSFLVRGVVLVSGFVLALQVLGVAGLVGAVLGTLGIVGLVVGIGLKDWVANYFPALALSVHPPFKSGDLVQVGEHEGRVIKITPRVTVLMTTDGEQIRLPNAWMVQQTLLNLSHHRERRLRFTMVLSTEANLHRAQELGSRAIADLHGVLGEPPPFMRTQAFGRGFVEIEFFAWIDQDAVNFRSVASHARRAVFEAFVRHGVPLAEDSVLVRGTHPRRDLATSGGPGPDEAERLDEAFVNGQLADAARSDHERDLLAEGEARGERSGH